MTQWNPHGSGVGRTLLGFEHQDGACQYLKELVGFVRTPRFLAMATRWR